MAMHNTPHPGEFIAEVYLEPNNLSLWHAKQRVRLGNVGKVKLKAA
jgi:plasmid maintenance system antidote protein VapI